MGKFLRKHRQVISYLFWGACTTGVNFLLYVLLTRPLGLNYLPSNIIAWFLSVIFAFVVNKQFVFRAKNWGAAVVLPEFGKFFGARVFSGFLETGLLWLGVQLASWHDVLVKGLVSVLVIILNYLFSRFFIFRSRRS